MYTCYSRCMNTKRLVHAPDGAMIPGSLCEGEGDTTTHFGDVTCPDCLDAYDVHPRNWAWLTRTTNQIRGGAPVMTSTLRGRLPRVPNQPRTPLRSFRISDELYEAAQQKAANRGESVSDVVRRALERYVKSK